MIGCAGLFQALVKWGDPPHVKILTGREGSHRKCCDLSKSDIIAVRRQLTLEAATTLGLPESHIHTLAYLDGGIAIEHPETKRLQDMLTELSPDSVLVSHWGEGFSDYIQTAEIVKEMLKDKKVSIYEYCVWM